MQNNNYFISIFDFTNAKICDLKNPNITINGDIYNINLKKNINGYNELTFCISKKIIDQDGNHIDNPKVDFFQPQFKVKLNYKNKNYYFRIKKIEKIRDNKNILSILCVDASFDRLSRSGVTLSLIGETGNGEIGTAPELLTKVLAGSDWSVGTVEEFLQDSVLKVRTLKAERSNRYKLISDICGLFECYPLFNYENKTVGLVSQVGLDLGVTFRYGKNLKNITQTIESEIVTKLYVNGGQATDTTEMCNIQNVNPTREPYIFNFGYYVDAGVLSLTQQTDIETFNANIYLANDKINSLLQSINLAYNDINIKQSEKEGKTLTKSAKIQTKNEIDQKLSIMK